MRVILKVPVKLKTLCTTNRKQLNWHHSNTCSGRYQMFSENIQFSSKWLMKVVCNLGWLSVGLRVFIIKRHCRTVGQMITRRPKGHHKTLSGAISTTLSEEHTCAWGRLMFTWKSFNSPWTCWKTRSTQSAPQSKSLQFQIIDRISQRLLLHAEQTFQSTFLFQRDPE